MSKGSRINSTLAPERYSATELLVRCSSAPKLSPLHFAVEWAYVIDGMLETGKIDLVSGRANAESISAMLMTFPHLFPNNTNLWQPNGSRDPATDTLADTAIWESRSFFYKEAMAASNYAFSASRAENVADFRKSSMNLRQTCDGCHSTYQHKD
jgi:hypothetical protein